MHTIKPLDTEAVRSRLNHKLIVTVEEHNVIGGLGAAVAEAIAEEALKPRHLLLGIEDFVPSAGEYGYLLEKCGLSSAQITERILKLLKR